MSVDLYAFVGKEIRLDIYRRLGKSHRVYVGKLMGVGHTEIELEIKVDNGRRVVSRWVPRPYPQCHDRVQEVVDVTE